MNLLFQENGQWVCLDLDNDLVVRHKDNVTAPSSLSHAVNHNMAQIHNHARQHAGRQAEQDRRNYAATLVAEGSEVEVTENATTIKTMSSLSRQLNTLLADPAKMAAIYPELKPVADAMLAEIAKKGACSDCTLNAIRRRYRPEVTEFLKRLS